MRHARKQNTLYKNNLPPFCAFTLLTPNNEKRTFRSFPLIRTVRDRSVARLFTTLMKTDKKPPILIRQRDALKELQSQGVLKRMIANGWLKPVVKEKRYVAFRRSDFDAALDRMLAGEMPPPLTGALKK